MSPSKSAGLVGAQHLHIQKARKCRKCSEEDSTLDDTTALEDEFKSIEPRTHYTGVHTRGRNVKTAMERDTPMCRQSEWLRGETTGLMYDTEHGQGCMLEDLIDYMGIK